MPVGWKRPQWCRVAAPPLWTDGRVVVRRPCRALGVLWWSVLYRSRHDDLQGMGKGGGASRVVG